MGFSWPEEQAAVLFELLLVAPSEAFVAPAQILLEAIGHFRLA